MTEEKQKKFKRYNATLRGGIASIVFEGDTYEKDDFEEISEDITDLARDYLKDRGFKCDGVAIQFEPTLAEDVDEKAQEKEINDLIESHPDAKEAIEMGTPVHIDLETKEVFVGDHPAQKVGAKIKQIKKKIMGK